MFSWGKNGGLASVLTLFSLFVSFGRCIIPPQVHPQRHDNTSSYWQQYASRSNDLSYVPRWINPRQCFGVVDDNECQKMDEDFGKLAMRNRRMVQDRKGSEQRPLNYHDDSQVLHPHVIEEIQQELEGAILRSNHTASSERKRKLQTSNPNTFRVLVFLMQWTNHANRDLIAPEMYERLFNAPGDETDDELYPTGSIRRYFRINSYGKLNVVADIVPWMQTDNTESFYAGTTQGRSPMLRESFIPLLNELDGQGFDYTRYDGDGDGVMDMVIFLHSGYAAERGGVDCDDSAATADRRIVSQAGAANSDNPWTSSTSAMQLGSFVVASAFRFLCDTNIARIGTIAHEMVHPFGIPDLYDIEGPLDQNSGFVGGLGRYDIMSNPFGQRNNESNPGHLSAWTKIQLGWVTPIEITTSGTYQARPAELFSDDIYCSCWVQNERREQRLTSRAGRANRKQRLNHRHERHSF